MNLLIEAVFVTFVGLFALGYAARMLRRQQKRYDLQFEELTLCLNDLTERMERYEAGTRRQLREREAVVASSLNQLQTDLKLMQMKSHDPVSGRDAPELLEQAIQLAREGKHGDQIMRRTGLSMDVVDAITMLHSSRPRH
jgi:hypothetical protein